MIPLQTPLQNVLGLRQANDGQQSVRHDKRCVCWLSHSSIRHATFLSRRLPESSRQQWQHVIGCWNHVRSGTVRYGQVRSGQYNGTLRHLSGPSTERLRLLCRLGNTIVQSLDLEGTLAVISSSYILLDPPHRASIFHTVQILTPNSRPKMQSQPPVATSTVPLWLGMETSLALPGAQLDRYGGAWHVGSLSLSYSPYHHYSHTCTLSASSSSLTASTSPRFIFSSSSLTIFSSPVPDKLAYISPLLC